MKMINKKNYIVILSCVLIYACDHSSNQIELPQFFSGHSNIEVFSENTDPVVTFSFHNERVFGDSELLYISNRDKIGVDDKGRVYIENQKSIHVYEEDGKYIGKIGREGRGPGEFLTIHNISLKCGLLYVYDANQSKISVFDTESFELNREISIPLINDMRGMGDFAVLEIDDLIVGVRETKRLEDSAVTQRFMHYYLLDHSGNFAEPAIAIADISDYYEIRNQRGVSYPPVPFDRETLFSLSETGKIYLLWTDQIAIKVLDAKGNFLNGILYPFPNVPVKDDSDFPIFYETIGLSIPDTKQILGDRLPESYPAVSHFFVDDEERIWLSTIVKDLNIYGWWILEETGELITKFEWRRDEPIEVVKNSKMYTRETDEESGLVQVVRYRIEFEESI